jgi:hypothetical protein
MIAVQHNIPYENRYQSQLCTIPSAPFLTLPLRPPPRTRLLSTTRGAFPRTATRRGGACFLNTPPIQPFSLLRVCLPLLFPLSLAPGRIHGTVRRPPCPPPPLPLGLVEGGDRCLRARRCCRLLYQLMKIREKSVAWYIYCMKPLCKGLLRREGS